MFSFFSKSTRNLQQEHVSEIDRIATEIVDTVSNPCFEDKSAIAWLILEDKCGSRQLLSGSDRVVLRDMTADAKKQLRTKVEQQIGIEYAEPEPTTPKGSW